MGNETVVREEHHDEADAIRAVHDAAFGRHAEGRLVDRLRSDGLIAASVVGAVDDEIVANAVFSRIVLRTASGLLKAVALAPVAVLPSHQRNGFGSEVVAYGLKRCAERGFEAAFVLGDPAYYSRFGFSPEIARAVSSAYASAGDAWMALKLATSSVSWQEASVEYPDAFSIV